MEILVVYSGFSRRPSLVEPLLAFQKYGSGTVSYYNSRLPFSDMHLHGKNFDLIIFSTLFFSRRVNKNEMFKDFSAVEWLKKTSAIKVATPQDEYINSKYVNEFFDLIGVSLIYSVQPENVWSAVYPNYQDRNIKILPLLTGYLDDSIVDTVIRDGKYPLTGRTVDIGYRTTGVPPVWYGRHARLKIVIAEKVKKIAKSKGLAVDISTDEIDSISQGWYEFLASCRYTIGVEGGTSIIDYDGKIKESVDLFFEKNPNASFEEIENNCFPDIDGSFPGYAISPRHLEACLTRTCQILIEGTYNDVLTPWRHYIPLKKDFSNLDVVMNYLSNDECRVNIANAAFDDIVRSGKYLNSNMVNSVIGSARSERKDGIAAGRNKFNIFLGILGVAYNSPNGLVVSLVEYLRRIKSAYSMSLK